MAKFRSDGEILSRLSPAFLTLLEFVREQKVNQAPGATISQTEKEVKIRDSYSRRTANIE